MTLQVGDKAARVAELLLAAKAVRCTLETPGRPLDVDVRKLYAAVNERREILWHLAVSVRDQAFDAVAGGPLGAWMAELVGLPHLTRELEGGLQPGWKVLIVEDVDLLPALRAAGAVCEHAVIVYSDGLLAAPEGLTLHAATSRRPLAEAVEKFAWFTPEQRKALRDLGT